MEGTNVGASVGGSDGGSEGALLGVKVGCSVGDAENGGVGLTLGTGVGAGNGATVRLRQSKTQVKTVPLLARSAHGAKVHKQPRGRYSYGIVIHTGRALGHLSVLAEGRQAWCLSA